MKFLLTSLTFWMLLIFGILVGLQWFPMTGVILMMFAAPIWVGYMPYVIALALFFDLLIKKAPKFLLIFPVLPCLIYYGYFFAEGIKIKDLETDLRKKNPSEIIAYDPEVHSLIVDSNMTEHYEIPVSYSYNNNFPEGFLSHRLVTQNLCKKAKGIKEFTHTFGVSWSSYGKNRFYKRFPNVCHFRTPEKPTKARLKVERLEDQNKKQKLQKTTYKFYLDNEFLGEYTSAYYIALPAFPQFVIGCSLISSAPEWKCVSQLVRTKKYLDTFPSNSTNNSKDDWIVARLLGIKKYTEDDLKNFQDLSETKKILGDLIEQKDNETSEDIDEWGLRKDSLYQPTITEEKGYPRFLGVVYSGNKGGPFRDFIEQNEGKIVYLDIEAKPNARQNSFMNYGVCRAGEKCTNRTDNSYQFKNEDGSWHNFEEKGKFKGFFSVGSKTLFENQYNKGDNDTITILTFVPQEKLK